MSNLAEAITSKAASEQEDLTSEETEQLGRVLDSLTT
jgi:hypothetical protein